MAEKLEPTKINRTAILLAVWLGMSVGVAPFMILIERIDGWLLVSFTCLLVPAIYLLLNPTTSYHKPIAGEYLLAAFDTTFAGAFLALGGMAFYYLLYWIMRGVDWLLVRYFDSLGFDATQWAYVVTIIVTIAFFAIMAGTDAAEIKDSLAPETAGLRSPYYYMLTVERNYLRTTLYWLVAILILLLIGLFVWPKGWIPLVLLQFYLFIGPVDFLATNIQERIDNAAKPAQETERAGALPGQSALASIGAADRRKEDRKREERASILVGDLYKAAGWEVEAAPRTNDPAVDPLLVDVDLFVTRESAGIVVDVISTPDNEVFSDFRRPPVISQAVWLFSDYRELNADMIGASMILVDTQIDEALVKVCRRMGINLIRLSNDQFKNFKEVYNEDPEKGSALAAGLLQLPNPAVA